MTVGLGRGRFTYKKEDILLQEMSSEVAHRENMKSGVIVSVTRVCLFGTYAWWPVPFRGFRE